MKQVYIASGPADAEFVRALLRTEGIGAVIQGDTIMLPSAPLPSVWVPDEDEIRARELLDDVE